MRAWVHVVDISAYSIMLRHAPVMSNDTLEVTKKQECSVNHSQLTQHLISFYTTVINPLIAAHILIICHSAGQFVPKTRKSLNGIDLLATPSKRCSPA